MNYLFQTRNLLLDCRLSTAGRRPVICIDECQVSFIPQKMVIVRVYSWILFGEQNVTKDFRFWTVFLVGQAFGKVMEGTPGTGLLLHSSQGLLLLSEILDLWSPSHIGYCSRLLPLVRNHWPGSVVSYGNPKYNSGICCSKAPFESQEQRSKHSSKIPRGLMCINKCGGSQSFHPGDFLHHPEFMILL